MKPLLVMGRYPEGEQAAMLLPDAPAPGLRIKSAPAPLLP